MLSNSSEIKRVHGAVRAIRDEIRREHVRPDQQLSIFKRFVRTNTVDPDLLPALEDCFLLGLDMATQSEKHWQKKTAFFTAVCFIGALLVLAVAIPNPTPTQFEIFRVVMALSAAGFAGLIPGFLDLKMGGWLRAGGAIAVFVLVYFFSPANLIVDSPSNSTDPSGIAVPVQ